MDKVRVGVIGLGNMGNVHASNLAQGLIPGAVLGAVCDINPSRLEWARAALGEGFGAFDNATAMFEAGVVDAVMIATPHYFHPPLAIEAFGKGLHVLTEKPAGVYTRQVREMNEAAAASGKVFGIMFNQRTSPLYQKVRDLVQSGELGPMKRIIWLITNWYRPQSYYDSGGWRATWSGEGGGVLANQDPHQLDLWQWMCGMPTRVRAFCHFGKWHSIEVEDDVTAYMEYSNGATGVWVTSTADAPGTNRFEISADNGRLVVEDSKLVFWRLRKSERQFNAEYKGGFGEPETWRCEIPVHGHGTEHIGITTNWIDAIRNGARLLAPGEEGIWGLTLANAMHLSAWTDNWVDLPIDEDLYYEHLQKRIAESRLVKKSAEGHVLDVSGTHNP